MNIFGRGLRKVDSWQRQHKVSGFCFAVIKKYSDDEAAYHGALITYYGFLSLFPLLIVVISLLHLAGDSRLSVKVMDGILHYFPVAGQQLQTNIHGLQHSGLKLAIGIVITLYGARGVADALRHSIDHIWLTPPNRRRGFPKNAIASLAIILIGGCGLVVAEVLSGFAAALGHAFIFRIAASLVSSIVIFVALLAIFRLSTTSKYIKRKAIVYSALVGAIGLQILHSLGGYIITHELQHLTLLYGVFALVLGMMFWIYLQAQVILYALEIGSVQATKLWPRRLASKQPTDADSRADEFYKYNNHKP